MGVGVFVHHVGTLLLLVATGLLIVSDISAPVVNKISIMNVKGSDGQLNFGTFGWCLRLDGDGSDKCSSTQVGYNPASVMRQSGVSVDFSTAAEDTTKALTNVMVLHAVATGFSFIAFLLCLGTSCVGSLVASLVALAAFIVAVIAVVCDFVGWSIFKHEINDHSSNDSLDVNYGPAIWCVLAAGVCTLVAAVLVFVTCCAGRIKDRRHARRYQAKY